jgi:hypothetical protein
MIPLKCVHTELAQTLRILRIELNDNYFDQTIERDFSGWWCENFPTSDKIKYFDYNQCAQNICKNQSGRYQYPIPRSTVWFIHKIPTSVPREWGIF